MDYITGSLCLDQFNIIKYYNRPYVTVAEMNDSLINNINAVVKENDNLFVVGDFVFTPNDYRQAKKNIKKYRSLLNCRKLSLVLGNSDARFYGDLEFEQLFYRVGHYLEHITSDGVSLILFHYPIRETWNRKNTGGIQCYAHCHGEELHKDIDGQLDVSVDAAYIKLGEYRPFSVEEVVKYSSKLSSTEQ